MEIQVAAANGFLRLREMHLENFSIQFHLNKSCCQDAFTCVGLPKMLESEGCLTRLEAMNIYNIDDMAYYPKLQTVVWCYSTWCGDPIRRRWERDGCYNLFGKVFKKNFKAFKFEKFYDSSSREYLANVEYREAARGCWRGLGVPGPELATRSRTTNETFSILRYEVQKKGPV